MEKDELTEEEKIQIRLENACCEDPENEGFYTMDDYNKQFC